MHEADGTLPHAAPARARTRGKGCVGCVVHACTLRTGCLHTPSRLMRAVHCIVISARPYRPLAVPCCTLACGAVNRMIRAPTCDGSTLCARAPARFGRVFHAHAWARVLPYQIHPGVRMCHYPRASPRRKRRARAGPLSGSERRRLLRISGLLAPPTGPLTNTMRATPSFPPTAAPALVVLPTTSPPTPSPTTPHADRRR